MSAGWQRAGSHGVFACLYLCICVRPNTVHVRQAVKERDRIVGEELISPPASDAATAKQGEDKTKSGKNRENFFIFVESLGAGTKGSKIEVKSIETFQLEMAIT